MGSCGTKQADPNDSVKLSTTQAGVDPRFLKTSGVEAFTGNELLLKGALEAGVALITGYPGSPVSDVFDAIHAIAPYMASRGVVAQIANNEALSTARLNGARQAGLRALAVMKSVGLHVGADALATGNLMEFRNPKCGGVVVVGDDPWNETTQINSDSRYLSKHLHMPVVEPSTFQELKDWLDHAFTLSGFADLYVTYIVTTNQADGGCTVKVSAHPEIPISRIAPTTLSSSNIKISDSVLIPPHTSMREATLADRHERIFKKSHELGLNKWFGPRRARMPVGFITSGLSFCYLEEVLKMIGLGDRTPVLKLGVTYPINPADVLELAKHVEHLVVVEEKRGFLEEQVAEILIDLKQSGSLAKTPALWGKKFPNNEPGFPSTRGLNVSVMLEVLGPAFLNWKEYFPTLQVELIEKELAEILHTKSDSYEVPLRLPTFCPGCPHRDSAVVSSQMKKRFVNFDYMKKKGEKPVDVIFHGESGCHSMLQFAPNEGLMQNYSGMGLGGGTGAGMSPFITNKQVVFLGDSTFFHSGMIAISDSLKNNQEITYVILENDTTAMTGHQPTPGNGVDIMGRPTANQDIERLLRGMLPETVSVTRANPADRAAYEQLLEATVLKPGVKIIIADKECAITLHRRLTAEKKQIIREQGFIAREEKVNITPDVCEYCLECTRQTGCPGLTVEETPYGRKIVTDLSTCVDDGACARTKACPSFEKVVITRSKPSGQQKRESLDLANLPMPRPEKFDGRWSAYTAGVGGMGAGVVNAVLVRAGMKAGYDVSFLDKKGLAIRNGGVYGHVVFSAAGPVSSPVIPYGKADLLIGLDLLEAARGTDARINLRVAHPGRTRGVINNHKHETVLSLMGRQDFDPDKLEEVLHGKIRLGGYFSADFSKVSEEKVGSKLYANMMILGAAFQKGWLPVSEDNIFDAITESVRKADIESNKTAFQYGRYLAIHPELLQSRGASVTASEIVREKADYLRKNSVLLGNRRAKSYTDLMDQAFRWMDLPAEQACQMARMTYDLMRYEGPALARRYVILVWQSYRRDQRRFNWRATSAVISNLYKVIAIKDEVWVAELLTSAEKYERDRKRYNIDSSRGDQISYVHLNRPRFTILGKDIEFDMNTKDWMLNIMKHAKFLRKWLPQWHAKENAFRDWYISLVENFTFFESPADYDAYVRALSVPEPVKGYREIRYPKMDAARLEAANALATIGRSATAAAIPIRSQ
jgi:indolepyruvate ferredoxin oxidoreductase